jgi:hypothetical protein
VNTTSHIIVLRDFFLGTSVVHDVEALLAAGRTF